MNRTMLFLATILASALLPAASRSQDLSSEPARSHPLDPFETLIGGRWHHEDSYQELEWGVGRHSVKARSYFVVDGSPTLVSEGFWFWHPAENAIRGVFTAVQMPVVLFEYTTRFEGDRMISELKAYDAEGDATTYEEVWDFGEVDLYVWTLSRRTPEGLREEMTGTYSREPLK